jgi:predicted enzyme related to lactoylglutathione lyase
MPVARFNFVKVPVRDLAAQSAFYQAAFGFVWQADFDNDEMEEALLRQEEAGFQLCLMRLKAAPPAGAAPTIGVLGFVCDDIDAAMMQALDAGADLKQSVFEVAGTKIALVIDPEGNEIEFVQFS